MSADIFLSLLQDDPNDANLAWKEDKLQHVQSILPFSDYPHIQIHCHSKIYNPMMIVWFVFSLDKQRLMICTVQQRHVQASTYQHVVPYIRINVAIEPLVIQCHTYT